MGTGEREGREEIERGYVGIDKGEGKAHPLNGLHRRQKVDIGCFLKRFSINVKKKCKKK